MPRARSPSIPRPTRTSRHGGSGIKKSSTSRRSKSPSASLSMSDVSMSAPRPIIRRGGVKRSLNAKQRAGLAKGRRMLKAAKSMGYARIPHRGTKAYAKVKRAAH
jgi:hypothetical protein